MKNQMKVRYQIFQLRYVGYVIPPGLRHGTRGRAALRSARHAGKNPLRAGGWWLWLPLRVFLFDVEDFVFEARQEMMHVAEQG